jgi:hypothetical protein
MRWRHINVIHPQLIPGAGDRQFLHRDTTRLTTHTLASCRPDTTPASTLVVCTTGSTTQICHGDNDRLLDLEPAERALSASDTSHPCYLRKIFGAFRIEITGSPLCRHMLIEQHNFSHLGSRSLVSSCTNDTLLFSECHATQISEAGRVKIEAVAPALRIRPYIS